jgi:hypothetical protein
MSNSQHRNEPIAIIGSGCRFPGGSNSASTLWELLKNPKDVSQGIGSGGRFNQKQFYHSEAGHTGTTNTERAYLLSENVRNFDAKFFSIPPGEAEAIDPQQRILLEAVYEAVESAGLTINGLSGSDTSCYVGIMCQDFFVLQAQDLLSVPKVCSDGHCCQQCFKSRLLLFRLAWPFHDHRYCMFFKYGVCERGSPGSPERYQSRCHSLWHKLAPLPIHVCSVEQCRHGIPDRPLSHVG